MKLWSKENITHEKVHAFTSSSDREADVRLAPYDVFGSMAHAIMLGECGIISREEAQKIHTVLKELILLIEEGRFEIDPRVEDVHSQLELMLTGKLGETGKKVHTGRSRNDQVLTALNLFSRDRLSHLIGLMVQTVQMLVDLSEKHKNMGMPGYTHMQVAMPSTFGLWFAAYAESLVEDLSCLKEAYTFSNRSPLGSAAGYGSSFPVNRELSADLLMFKELIINVVNVQMTRGKLEKKVTGALAEGATTLARLAGEMVLFMGENFGFFSFPETITTGSSIMPHKKNPDVFELIRARCNYLQSLPHTYSLLLSNLPGGYHRDYQELKSSFMNSFDQMSECLQILNEVLPQAAIREDILDAAPYRHIYSVDRVHELVRQGTTFRDAYHRVAEEIKKGMLPGKSTTEHRMTGSKDNLSNELIINKMKMLTGSIDLDITGKMRKQLLQYYESQ